MIGLSALRRLRAEGSTTALLVVAAACSGLLLARLPLLWAALGLLIVILLVLTLCDPLVGLGVALILGPTKPLTDYFVPRLPLDIGQIALIVTLGTWLLHAVRRRALSIPPSPFSLPILLFLGAASLSLLNALSLGYAAKELIKWTQLLIVMWLVAGERRWQVVVGLVLTAALIQALIGIWQFGLRGEGPEHFLIMGGRFYRAYGTFEQPNPYAGFLGLCLPLSIGLTLGALTTWAEPFLRTWQSGCPVTALRQGLNRDLLRLCGLAVLSGLLLAALLMSWSRGAWLGFGAAGLVILFAWPRRAWLGALLLIGGAVAGATAFEFDLLPPSITARLTGFTDFIQSFDVRGVDINDANYAVLERLAHWQAAQEMARYHPLLGVGFGNYEPVYPAYALINWPFPLGHAHNIYLNTLAETGIVGLVAYVGLWVAVVVHTWAVTRRLDGWPRSLAIGLLGTWTHLSVHSFLDKLYVANLHLHIGALLGILSILINTRQMRDRYD